MSKGTDRRTVRVAPELWEAARTVAASQDESVSDVIRAALLDYVDHQRPCNGNGPCRCVGTDCTA